MNRRSLLLGGVVASVAGILGVKAEVAEPDYPSWVQVDPLSIYPAWHHGRLDEVIENIGDSTSGYQVTQLMPHGTPPMRPRPYPFVIDPGDDITFSGVPVPNYWYSINPDLSDLT